MLSPTLPAVFEFGSTKKTTQKTGLSHEMKEKSFPVTLKVSKKVLSRLDSRTDTSRVTDDHDTRDREENSLKTNGREIKRSEKDKEKERDREKERERDDASASRTSSSSATTTTSAAAAARIPAARDLDKSTTPTKAKSKAVSPSRDEETKQQFKLLRKKMRTWLDLARAKKHMSDAKYQNEEFGLASAAAMDSLLCYIIAFNYEERADRLMNRELQDKSWGSLVNFINRVNFLLEAAKQPHLVSCCYLMRALIQVRVGLVLGAQIKSRARDNESDSGETPAEKAEKAESLALSLFRTQEGFTSDFRRANRGLPLSQISQSFPKSYARRSKTATPVVHDGGYRPWSDEYALPLHVYSSLQEAAALGWNMTDEWIRMDGLKYDWACRALA